jgi:hypothetical protein
MIEFLIVAGVASATVGAVAGGISLGSRYVDAKLRYEHKNIPLDQPIVAPQFRRSGNLGEQRAA